MFMSRLPRQGQELMFQTSNTPEIITGLPANAGHSPEAEITNPVLRAAYDRSGPHIDIDQRKNGLQEISHNLNEASRMHGFITASENPPHIQSIQARYGNHLMPIQDHAVAKHNRLMRNAHNGFLSMQKRVDLINAGFNPQAVDEAINNEWRAFNARYGSGVSHAKDRKEFIGHLASRSSLDQAIKDADKKRRASKSS